ncbi:MAG: hypothetical protein WC836_09000 [Desulfobacula sp.]|jgi:hypothetical protein
MKKISVFLCGLFLLLVAMGSANATLTTIGTAQFNGTGTAYNLIWDDNNNGNSVVWLDYIHGTANWTNQRAWATGLDGVLTYNTPGYTVDFGANSWRLPSTVDGPHVYGYDGTTTAGYNITTSEMGHLFYTELGNLGYYGTNGAYQSGYYGLVETGDFNNLVNTWYWSGTEYASDPARAWSFSMYGGPQDLSYKSNYFYGLAVRTGQVSTVPVPGAFWLLGSGLVGLAGLARKR